MDPLGDLRIRFLTCRPGPGVLSQPNFAGHGQQNSADICRRGFPHLYACGGPRTCCASNASRRTMVVMWAASTEVLTRSIPLALGGLNVDDLIEDSIGDHCAIG